METLHHESSPGRTSVRVRTVLTCLLQSKGALPLLLVASLLAFGIGCVVAIVSISFLLVFIVNDAILFLIPPS
jgi:hypothetical protein